MSRINLVHVLSVPQSLGCEPHHDGPRRQLRRPPAAAAPLAGRQQLDGGPHRLTQTPAEPPGSDVGAQPHLLHTRQRLLKPHQSSCAVSRVKRIDCGLRTQCELF